MLYAVADNVVKILDLCQSVVALHVLLLASHICWQFGSQAPSVIDPRDL